MAASGAGSSLSRGKSSGKEHGSVDIHNPDPQVVDIVSRHLVHSPNHLQLQGGDMTRDLYKWSNDQQQLPSPRHGGVGTISPSSSKDESSNSQMPALTQRRRSISFSGLSVHSASTNNHLASEVPGTTMTHEEIRAPGGFRRSFIMRQHERKYGATAPPPNFFARNFIEFLTLYGRFAGQDLEEDEDEDEEEDGRDGNGNADEESVLLERVPTKDSRKQQRKATTFKAVLLLLKSFVGTGVLFLPRAFHNGGWAFSTGCLLFCAIASSLSFVLLIKTKDKVGVSGYGDLGRALYGSKVEFSILFSIALSQLGFSAAYTVFTATNLKVFCENALNVPVDSIPLSAYIILQALIFIPLSLTRNIAKLSGTALIADLFILLGLLYIYYYPALYIAKHGMATDSVLFFNSTNWSLFIGTAIFTFEGIGLLIPIQESMRKPQHFYPSLGFVMFIVTFIFISSGLLCYCAFGAKVETVVLLNFPQDSIATMSVQLIYSLAILLSTPLQLFPAIRIFETWTFPSNASGKHSHRVKWLKNYFRTGIVIFTALLAWVGANDLDKFVSLVGSFACIPLIYVYPPLLHLKSSGPDTSKIILLGDLLIFLFGMGVMTYTSYQNIVLWGN